MFKRRNKFEIQAICRRKGYCIKFQNFEKGVALFFKIAILFKFSAFFRHYTFFGASKRPQQNYEKCR